MIGSLSYPQMTLYQCQKWWNLASIQMVSMTSTFPSDPPSDIPPDMPAGLVLPQCTLVRIVEDLTRESNETFYVFLSSEGDFSTVGIDVAEIHIIDNDCKPSFSFYCVLPSELKHAALLLSFASLLCKI